MSIEHNSQNVRAPSGAKYCAPDGAREWGDVAGAINIPPLTRGVTEVNDQAKAILAINTRALSGARAFYGPDSAQYEQLGGTRASERKPRKKKPSGS